MPLVQHGMLNMEVFWSIVMGVCASVITISSALGVFMSALKKFKAPEVSQNEEIKELKLDVDEIKIAIDEHKKYFNNDNTRIKKIEEGNKITQKALLALMAHALDDKSTDQLVEAKSLLQNYLIERDL